MLNMRACLSGQTGKAKMQSGKVKMHVEHPKSSKSSSLGTYSSSQWLVSCRFFGSLTVTSFLVSRTHKQWLGKCQKTLGWQEQKPAGRQEPQGLGSDDPALLCMTSYKVR